MARCLNISETADLLEFSQQQSRVKRMDTMPSERPEENGWRWQKSYNSSNIHLLSPRSAEHLWTHNSLEADGPQQQKTTPGATSCQLTMKLRLDSPTENNEGPVKPTASTVTRSRANRTPCAGTRELHRGCASVITVMLTCQYGPKLQIQTPCWIEEERKKKRESPTWNQ